MAAALVVAKNVLVVLGLVGCALSFFVSYAIAWATSLCLPSLRRVWLEYLKATYSQACFEAIWFTSPSRAKIYSSSSGVRFEVVKGQVRATMCPRAVIMSNHQTYVDWAYLWWLAYAADCHSAVCIMLKESLGKIPIFGWIMHCFRFVFLSRNYADDEPVIKSRIAEMNARPKDLLWFVMYPEGTVVNKETHERTEKYAEKADIPRRQIPKHMLLPRSRGLQTVLQGLHSSTKVLYDVTVVYSPVSAAGEPAETFYSMPKTFFRSEGAPVVQYHVREFAIHEIPYQNDEEFAEWLRERYVEKDEIYEQLSSGALESELRAEGPIKMRSLWNLYACFNMPVVLVLTARLLYKFLR